MAPMMYPGRRICLWCLFRVKGLDTMKKAVITGPTGAIGMALIKKFISERKPVLAICHKGSSRIGNIPDSPFVTVLEADLSEYKTLSAGCGGAGTCDVFYHFAWNGTVGEARNDMHLQSHNIADTMEAVELAGRLGCHTFIGAGSQAEYGRTEGMLTPELPTAPENGYGMAKLCAGQMSRVMCEKMRMKHIWCRVLSVYGPYDGAGSMVMSAIRKFISGEQTAFTPGEQTWDYLYSKDAAEIFYALGDKGIHGSVYCVGSGQERMLKSYIKDIYQVVKENAGCRNPKQSGGQEEERLEERLGIGRIPYGEKQVMHLCADTTLLEQHIGPLPYTDFRQGIREILEENQGFF